MDASDRTQLELFRIEVRGEFKLLNERMDRIVERGVDHEQRIRSVERWKLSIPISALLAIATIIGAVAGRV